MPSDKSGSNSESNKEERFLRGLLLLAAGVFLLLRFAAVDRNPFFVGAMWLTGLVALVALIFLLWRIYSKD